MTQAQAIAIRQARHARVRVIRQRVVAGVVALFIATWLLITVMLVTGHDPALARQTAKTTSSTLSSSSSSSSGATSTSTGGLTSTGGVTSTGTGSLSSSGQSSGGVSSVSSSQS